MESNNDLYLQFKILYLDGITFNDILEKLYITSYRYSIFLNRFRSEGLETRDEKEKKLKNEAVRLRKEQSLSVYEISQILNISWKSVMGFIGGIKSYNCRNCKACSKEHYCEYGGGEFCSETCSRSFSSRLFNRDLYWQQRGLGKQSLQKQCLNCGIVFTANCKKRKYCSNRCSGLKNSKGAKRRKISEATRSKLKKVQQDRIANGTHNGWATRKKLQPSFAEQWFIDFLNKNGFSDNVHYERERKVGKYFIDFAFTDLMIAIEIDGKQHEYADRKKKDEEKDNYLRSEGWKIIRLKWMGVKGDKYTSMIKEAQSILSQIVSL